MKERDGVNVCMYVCDRERESHIHTHCGGCDPYVCGQIGLRGTGANWTVSTSLLFKPWLLVNCQQEREGGPGGEQGEGESEI